MSVSGVVIASMMSVLANSNESVDKYIASMPPETITTTVRPPAETVEVIQQGTTSGAGSSATPQAAEETPEVDNSNSPTPGNIPGVSQEDEARFDRLAFCESTNNWSINTGNGFHGGLQFLPSTWDSFKPGTSAANIPYAYQATREQQIEVAKKVQLSQGWGAWPACSAKYGYI